MNATLDQIRNDNTIRSSFFNTLMGAIAAELGGHAEVQEYGDSGRINLDASNSENYLYVRLDTYKGRVSVSGNACVRCKKFPGNNRKAMSHASDGYAISSNDFYPRLESAEATMDCFKSAATIAADIKRRVLPAHTATLATLQARAAQYDIQWCEKLGTASMIARALGAEVNADTFETDYNGGGMRVSGVAECDGARVKLTVDALTVGQAEKLAFFLAEMLK